MNDSLTSWQLLVLTLVVTCIGIAPTFWLLWPKWMDSFTYSHGLLVVPICIWLLLDNRDRINAEPAEATLWATPVLFGLLLVWIIAFAANIEIGVEALMPLIILSALLLVVGKRITKLAAFPVLLIFSAIPIWDYINGILQSLTTIAVSVILAAIRVPAYIDGNSVQIPSGWFEIAGGCSGLHFLIVGITLAAVYAYMYLESMPKRLGLVVIVVVMSIVMNWIRVATIITAGHLTNMQSYLVQIDHYYFGWILFAVMLVPFFLIARRLEGPGVSTEPDIPTGDSLRKCAGGYSSIVAIFAIMLLPVLVWGRLVQNSAEPISIRLPEIPGLQGPREYSGSWSPIFVGADGEVRASYHVSNSDIVVFANWYKTQSQGRELIGFGSSVVGRTLQRISERDYVDLTAGNAAKLPEIREIIARSASGHNYVIWYHYLVGGLAESSRLQAQLEQGVYAVFGGNGTGLIAASISCQQSDCVPARHILRENYSDIARETGNALLKLNDDKGRDGR